MFDKLKQILHNRIVSNASWLVAGKVIQMVINLIVGLMTARYLGPSNYGLINYGAAYTGFFSALCTLGINSVIVKEFIDQPGEEGKILGTSLGLRFFSGLFSVITIICVSFVLDTGIISYLQTKGKRNESRYIRNIFSRLDCKKRGQGKV